MQSLVEPAEFLVKRSFVGQFRGLTDAPASAGGVVT